MLKAHCLKKGKKRCGECSNCAYRETQQKFVAAEKKIKQCPLKDNHSHPETRELCSSALRQGYTGGGVIEKIVEGPTNVLYRSCTTQFSFYLVKWKNDERKFHQGRPPGCTWIEISSIPQNDLAQYFRQKRKRFKKRGKASSFGQRNDRRSEKEPEEEVPQQPLRKNGALEEEEEEEESIQQLSEELVNFFTEKSEEFCAARKMRGKTLPADLVPPEAIQKYQEKECHDALHSADVPGITCVDLQKKFILTGGLDKTIVLFNIETETIENTFKGHQERINAICLHPDLQTIVSGSQDSQIRIWSAKESFAHFAIGIHDSAITGLSLHPTRDHVLCTYEDCHMSLIDINVGRSMIKVPTGEDDITLNCGQFHPDGLLFATGAKSSIVKIWDIKEQNYVAEFSGHQDSVCTISFSENGYYLATGSLDGEVKIWDLRKHKNLKTLVMNNTKTAVKSLTFDKSGEYLAVAGANVQVFQVKKWNKIAQFDGHSQMVTGVRFGDDAKFIASGSLDKTVRIYTTAEQ